MDTPLTALGRRQARALAPALAGVGFARVFSSDLSRAVDTAQLATQGGGVPVVQVPALRERSMGEWAHARKARLRADGSMASLLTWTGAAPGGESQQDMARRVLPWLAGLAPLDGPTLVVAHGGVLRVVLGLLDGGRRHELGREVVANAAPLHRRVSASRWRELAEVVASPFVSPALQVSC